MTETVDRVVRRWGSDKTHVVTVPEETIQPASMFRTEFDAISGRLTARCGTRVNRPSEFAVVMRPGTRVLCLPCRHITGIEYAGPEQGRGERQT